jgi:hypothetical protein
MQYSKLRAMPIAWGIHKIAMLLRQAHILVLLLLGLCLAGCTDTMPDRKPLKRFTDLVRGYDRTLTEEEKQRVIKQLREDKERQGLVDPAENETAEQKAETAAKKTAKSQVEN